MYSAGTEDASAAATVLPSASVNKERLPANAVVVCVDEKSQIQALDRTAPLLPMRFDQAERRTHDYKRHGTTTLFAALEVATGRITADACYQRHHNGEFLAFLKQVAKAHPRVKLHVVADNYGTHSHPNVKAWLAKNPRTADQILAKAHRQKNSDTRH